MSHPHIGLSETDLLGLLNGPAPAVSLAEALERLAPEAVTIAAERAAQLHNAGKLNFFRLATDPQRDSLGPLVRYHFDQFTGHVLPLLDATPTDMVALIRGLAGEEDIGSSLHLAGFKRWCAADGDRWRAVTDTVESGDLSMLPFLAPALQASNDPAVIERFLALGGRVRTLAIHSLGWLRAEPEISERCLAVLDAITATDDRELGAILNAAANAATQVDAPHHDAFEALGCRIARTGGPATQREVARTLSLHHKLMSPAWVTCALRALDALDLSDPQIVSEVDNALASLMRHGHEAAAIDFLTQRLSAPDIDPGLAAFDHVCHVLRRAPSFEAIVARWLASGAPRICRDLPTLLASRSAEGDPIDAPIKDLGFDPEDLAFLARKAVSFLFNQQLTAASILAGVLRAGESKSSALAVQLLFDPLLMSYPGSVRTYLEGIDAEDDAYAGAQAALALARVYEDDLAAVGEIKELAPSERQREVQRRRHQDAVAEMQETAMERSIFRDIFPVSRILHGRAVRSIIADPGGTLRVIDTPMSGQRFGWEISRTEIADTVGLNHQILSYKLARRPA